MFNYIEKGRALIPNKATPISITFDDGPGLLLLNFASVIPGRCYPAGVPGYYYLFGERTTELQISTGRPLLAEFKETGNAVIFAHKFIGTSHYLYGITIEKLLDWSEHPPQPQVEVKEAGLLQSWKVPRDDLVKLEELCNTDTHKLIDIADSLISRLPIFKAVQVRSAKEMQERCKKTFKANMLSTITAAEKAGRKGAQGKGRAANDPDESASGGAVVGAKCAQLRAAVAAAEQYYDADPFLSRFVFVQVDSDLKPMDDELIKTKEELRCATCITHTI